MKTRYFIGAVWLVNGLFCKILNLTPRHQDIVGRILGEALSRPLTVLIGIAECVMALWIVIGWFPKLTTWAQIVLILAMNILEGWLASDLLLWGRWNGLWAFCFCGFLYYNEHRRNLQLCVN